MIVVRSTTSTRPRKGILMNKKRTIASIITVLAFSAIFLAAQMQMPDNSANKPDQSSATPKTLTGIVSDSMCGAHHMDKNQSAADCTRMCVKQGMKHALIVGDKVYTLEGREAELDKLAGKKATVKGHISGETVAVQSAIPAKQG
jgi:hypothetical protein